MKRRPSAVFITVGSMAFITEVESVRTTGPTCRHGPAGDCASARPMYDVFLPKADTQ